MPAATAIHFFLELAVILATCRVVGLIAKRIGHDAARTRYEVDRTPRRPAAEHAAERQAPSFDPPERQQARPAPAMGM